MDIYPLRIQIVDTRSDRKGAVSYIGEPEIDVITRYCDYDGCQDYLERVAGATRADAQAAIWKLRCGFPERIGPISKGHDTALQIDLLPLSGLETR